MSYVLDSYGTLITFFTAVPVLFGLLGRYCYLASCMSKRLQLGEKADSLLLGAMFSERASPFIR